MTASSAKSETGPVATCLPLRNTVIVSQNARTSRRRWEMKTIVTPRSSEPRDDGAEPVDVAAGERRGRLVEQQNARLTKSRAGDFNLLLDREIKLADLVVERDVGHAERGEMRCDERARMAAADHAQWADRTAGQQHVVEDREVVDQGHLLERGLDAARVRARAARQTALPRRTGGTRLSGSASPESSLTIVDLPAPFSPSRAWTVPGAIANDASSTATVAP